MNKTRRSCVNFAYRVQINVIFRSNLDSRALLLFATGAVKAYGKMLERRSYAGMKKVGANGVKHVKKRGEE